MKPTLLILAAGMGSRYGGLKQMDELGPDGESIIDYSVFDAIRAGFGKVVFVIREDFAQAFKDRFEPRLKGKIGPTDFIFPALRWFSVPFIHTFHSDSKEVCDISRTITPSSKTSYANIQNCLRDHNFTHFHQAIGLYDGATHL